jgi:hypothetical protein
VIYTYQSPPEDNHQQQATRATAEEATTTKLDQNKKGRPQRTQRDWVARLENVVFYSCHNNTSATQQAKWCMTQG